jgi:hypothetical protein
MIGRIRSDLVGFTLIGSPPRQRKVRKLRVGKLKARRLNEGLTAMGVRMSCRFYVSMKAAFWGGGDAAPSLV